MRLPENQVVLPDISLLFAPVWPLKKLWVGGGGLQPPSDRPMIHVCDVGTKEHVIWHTTHGLWEHDIHV